MEQSILLSIKQVLGLSPDFLAFDQDVLMHINSTFAILDQLGVGKFGGSYIVNQNAVWADLELLPNQEAMVKSYVFLKVRLLFDPPATSFGLEAAKQQVSEFEWRLTNSFPLDNEVQVP